MKLLILIFLYFILFPCLLLAQIGSIQPYGKDKRFWEYKGEPVLLLGATNDDNLFQTPELEKQLDSLCLVGGNYIRNVMSSRKNFGFEEEPFHKLPTRKYDLNHWNPEYWRRFKHMLKLTEERDIIVQIELWAFHDFNIATYPFNPWKPANNINYDTTNTTLSNQSVNIGHHRNEFFFTVPNLNNDDLVLKYQKKFIDKILSYTLNYGHILYCMTNEIHPHFSPEWGWYWSAYIKEKASEKGKKIQTTEMFWQTDLKNEQHLASLNRPDLYDYFEISQNSANSEQTNWDYTQYIRNYISKTPRPINSVKIYGSDLGPSWAGNESDAVERFWRNLIGGCATSRFHRPNAGIGLNKRAQASIIAARKMEEKVKMWEVEPHSDLLLNRESNEAYLTCRLGEKYVIYSTNGGEVGLDLTIFNKKFTLHWIEINSGNLIKIYEVQGGVIMNISAPDSKEWLAILTS